MNEGRGLAAPPFFYERNLRDAWLLKMLYTITTECAARCSPAGS